MHFKIFIFCLKPLTRGVGFICLAASLLTAPLTSSALQCSSFLSSDQKIPNQRSLKTLINKMDILGINLELRHEIDISDPSNDYFEIYALNQNGESVGEITMAPERVPLVISGEERSLFTSHIDVTLFPGKNMKGSGLGTYLYAAAARTMYRIGGVLFSSELPSSEAKQTWEALVEASWATVGKERKLNNSSRGSSFRFSNELLSSGFFNELDEKIKDRDDVFLTLGED